MNGRRLFDGCDDDQLMLLGVPEALLPAVRAVNSDEALSRLIEWVPQSCVDGLILLADGRSIDEVIDELERKQPAAVDTSDVGIEENEDRCIVASTDCQMGQCRRPSF